MGRRTGLALLSVAIVVVMSGGCVPAFTHHNAELDSLDKPVGLRHFNDTAASFDAGPGTDSPNDDGIFVGLALSGGGLRSSNFSAACMFELERIGILPHVDCISSVSGGSVTAAYYCVGNKWTQGELQRRLTHSFATDLIVTTLRPWNLLALWATPFDRSDILADSFQRNLFTRGGRGLTFRDLPRNRPRLLMNATDLQTGRKFVFCNESFDVINSDLGRYPLAYAVTASSAVPVVLHQVTLRDYSTEFKTYRHLIDGGINDNLGVTSLVESYTHQVDRALQAGRPHPYPRGVVLIVIDAHTEASPELDDKPDVGLLESLAAGAGLSSTVLLNRISSATMADIIVNYSQAEVTAQSLRDQIKELNETGLLKTHDSRGKPVSVVHLSLTRVGELSETPFAGFGHRINNIATYFNIAEKEAYDLYKAADLLVHGKQGPRLKEIAEDLERGSAAAAAAAAAAASSQPGATTKTISE